MKKYGIFPLLFVFLFNNASQSPRITESPVQECISACCACLCPCYDEEDGFTCNLQFGQPTFTATKEMGEPFTSNDHRKPASPLPETRASNAPAPTERSPLIAAQK